MTDYNPDVAPGRRMKDWAFENTLKLRKVPFRRLGELSEARSTQISRSFSAKVRSVLETRLLSEDCSIIAVAKLFSMNRRTLSRHLSREGTAYQIMANELRFEIARELLARKDLTFTQVATALGYSELSGFTRAFRHWSGQTPTEWRAKRGRTRNKVHEQAQPVSHLVKQDR